MARKKIKRRKDHPFVAPSKRRPLKEKQAATRARLQAILARTRAGRAELDALVDGADISDLADLPVIVYPSGAAPKPPGLKRIGVSREEEELELAAEPATRPPIAPPVEYNRNELLDTRSKVTARKCGHCGRIGHTRPKCPEFALNLPEPIIVPPPIAEPVARDSRRSTICGECGRLGHNRKTCEEIKTDEQPPALKTDVLCTICGFRGHSRTRCPDAVAPDRWQAIDRVIASTNSLRAAAKLLGIGHQTLIVRLAVREDVATKRARAGRPAATPVGSIAP